MTQIEAVDEELIRMVVDSEDYRKAETIFEVKNAVRRRLIRTLIDLHMEDDRDVKVRQHNVKEHIEWITLRILKEFDGIVLIPEHYEELEAGRHTWKRDEIEPGLRRKASFKSLKNDKGEWAGHPPQ